MGGICYRNRLKGGSEGRFGQKGVEMIDCSKKVIRAIEARTREIEAGYNGGDIEKFSVWVSEALAFDTKKDGDGWKTFESWSKTADSAVVDAVWEAWTAFPDTEFLVYMDCPRHWSVTEVSRDDDLSWAKNCSGVFDTRGEAESHAAQMNR
jgi:hypothetical protein